MHLRGWGVATALAFFSLSGSALAQPSAEDRANAQTFFDRALALMKDNKFGDACPMLEESQRLDPGLGTQFQLARCLEGQGRVASAWIQFLDVADAAKAAGQLDKEKAARQRADAVAARVPKLQIDVAAASADAEVKRNGVVIRKIQWGTALPIDPGHVVVTATAPGRRGFEGAIDLKEGMSGKILVPELAREVGATAVPPPVAPPVAPASATPSAPPPASPPPPPASEGLGSRKTIALVVGGVGVVGLGVSVVLGLSAKSKYDGIGGDCVGDQCNQVGKDARASAIGTANVATIVGGVGLLAIAGGAVLWLTAPSPEKGASAYVTPSLGGVTMGGRF